MNPKIMLCLAVILSAGLFGCATTKTDPAANFVSADSMRLPIKLDGYGKLYTFIAEHDDNSILSTDPETLFKLASDSTKSFISLKNKNLPGFYLLESHFYSDGGDSLRGAQGNGFYYILRPLALGEGFELIGVLAGNTWKLGGTDEKPQLITTLHESAYITPKSVYEWNGKFFEQIE